MQRLSHMRRTPWLVGTTLLGLGVSSYAGTSSVLNDDEVVPSRAFERQHQPITAVDESAVPIVPFDPAEVHEGQDMGAGRSAPIEDFDPSLPLPIPAEYAPGPNGDVLVKPASGDPYFLGFVAGKYYPPANVLIDEDLVKSVQLDYADGRPLQETYGFLMLNQKVTDELVAELEELGARILGFHPHYNLKVAFPVASIDPLAAHAAVRWIGGPRDWQKLHPNVEEAIEKNTGNEPMVAYINVYEGDTMEAATSRPAATIVELDNGVQRPVPETSANIPQVVLSNGWQQKSLEGLGVEVLEYVDRIHAFRVEILPASVELIQGLDFVQFIEIDNPPELNHDESTPMINSDRGRLSYDGGTNSVITAGQADSGLENAHGDLNHIWGVGWDLAASGSGAWSDGCAHGTHVNGTILGTGDLDAGHTGNAPGLAFSGSGRFFNAKIFNDTCGWGGSSVSTILSVFESDYNDGTNISPRPNVVNHSWSTSGGPYTGTSADCRTIDQSVYDNDILYVWSAGNQGSGASTITEEPSSKNVMAVANVLDYRNSVVGDPGTLWSSSSRGPTADNRWRPSIAAPGRWITSADSGNTSGYRESSGTSMAAPHVTGVAAQLADHHSFLRYAPARLQAHMMATAITKDDSTISTPSTTNLDLYGAGRVESYRGHFGTSQMSWLNWGFDRDPSTYSFSDFTIPAGTTRVAICMVYHEVAASSGASQALVNDYDLWVDQDPVEPGGNTGEWFAQQSGVDNVEIRILTNPIPGTWRWKMYPDSATSSVHASVVVAYTTGDTTPDATLTVSASDNCVGLNQPVDISAQVTPASYVASAVFADSTVSSGATLLGASTTLKDGNVTDLSGNLHSGWDILLGNILHGDSRTANWTTSWSTEGVKTWSVNARSDNMVDKTTQVQVTVDGTPPGLPTNLVSTTHTPNVWSTNPNISYKWTAAVDALCGLSGYGEFTSTSPTGSPGATQDLGAVTSYNDTLSSNSQGWYFKLRPVDNVGNWSPTFALAGPYLIDAVAPTPTSNISSSSHTIGQTKCNTSITMNWTNGSDAHSGVQSIRVRWNESTNPANPNQALALAPGTTSYVGNVGGSSAPRYFHMWTEDVAGNFSTETITGPYFANDEQVTVYCTPKINSLGCTPSISYTGTPSLATNTFRIRCSNVLNNKPGILFWGVNRAAIPFQGGTLCVQPPTSRTANQNSGGNPPPNDCSGNYAFHWNNIFSASVGIVAGDTIDAQYWMRDPQSPSTTGLSDAIEVTFCP